MSSSQFINSPNYNEKITEIMNDTSEETINKAETMLQSIRDNVYSFETDSGKSDMITGKVVANFQWSGDAVYAMDQAEEDDYYLQYAVPKECSNLWCDGWVMLKSGINGNKEKQNVAEAFINYISRPDNVIRNMYYIGYTSCISGGDDNRIFEYTQWCYGADDDEENVVDYPLGFFFSGNSGDKNYILKTTEEQTKRQLFAQYPTEDVLDRCAVMMFFDDEANARMNQMWINVRCFNLKSIPVYVWVIIALAIILIALAIFVIIKRNKNYEPKQPKGYKKV
jgi:spermidine/putrescine transport system substrate-binding protein